MKRWLALALVLLVMGSMFGCAKKEAAYEPEEPGILELAEEMDFATEKAAAPARSAKRAEGGGAGFDAEDAPVTTSELDLPPARMVIKTANLSVRVKDVDAAYTRAMQLAEEHGGYVQSGTVSESEGARADITIKVNPREFTELIAILEKLGEVEYKSITGQDVTEEYFDLKEQLRTQLALKERLLGYLQKARNVEEMLYVEQEFERVDGNVNRIKGRMKYLETMVAESTIYLTIYSETPSKFINWYDIGSGFKTAAQILVHLFFGLLQVLVVVIPIAAVVLLIVWIIIRIVRKSKKKKSK